MGFTLYPAAVFRVHVAIIATLLAAHIGVVTLRGVSGHPSIFGVVPAFDLNGEGNLPTFFSGAALLAIAGAALFTASATARSGRSLASGWRLIAILFLALGLDELVQLHERLTEPVRHVLGLGSEYYFVWIIPYVAVLSMGAMLAWQFLRAVDRATRNGLLAGGSCLAAGAVGMEILGAWVASRFVTGGVAHVACMTIEETLEMLGAALILRSVIAHFELHFGLGAHDATITSAVDPVPQLASREAWLTPAEEMVVLNLRAGTPPPTGIDRAARTGVLQHESRAIEG